MFGIFESQIDELKSENKALKDRVESLKEEMQRRHSMPIWNSFSRYIPLEGEDVLLRMTNKKTHERYYTIGHMKGEMFNNRGMEPSTGFNDSDYAFEWIYISEMERIFVNDGNGMSMPGGVNG